MSFITTDDRLFFGRRGADNLRNAIAFYQQTIERNPQYGSPTQDCGSAQQSPRICGGRAAGRCSKAKAAAVKALLQLDDHFAEAHNAMGQVLFSADMDVPHSIAECQRAIALNPNSVTA